MYDKIEVYSQSARQLTFEQARLYAVANDKEP
jgi:hypothetical protein